MKKLSKVNEIIIHCSDTEAHVPLSRDDFVKWHVNERRFSDIGYHFIIQPDGSIIQGRSLKFVGAHCQGHNLHSIGICYVGGRLYGQYADTRTLLQKSTFIQLIKDLCNLFPIVKISGHRDYAHRACPCFDASKEYSHLIKRLL